MGKCKYGKIGERYGRLTIIGEAEPHIYPNGNKVRRVLVQCDCGTSEPFEVMLKSLRSGRTTSCGCYKREKTKEIHKKYNTYDLETCEYGVGYTTKGEEFYFDKEDYPKIKDYCWYIKNDYVVARDTNTNKTIQFHRLVMNASEGMEIDHIFHHTTDNRKSQLREVTSSQNQMNRRVTKRNTSGVVGAHWDRANNKWRAQITINRKLIYLGLFENLEDAAKARLEAEKKYFGEFSNNHKQ